MSDMAKRSSAQPKVSAVFAEISRQSKDVVLTQFACKSKAKAASKKCAFRTAFQCPVNVNQQKMKA
jgi:hypothetical protein